MAVVAGLCALALGIGPAQDVRAQSGAEAGTGGARQSGTRPVASEASLRANLPSVTSIRIGLQANRTTRFVLDVSKKVAFRSFTLNDPYRVVIDMQPVDWKIGSKLPLSKDGLIGGYRTGEIGGGNTRIVLDLNSPALIHQTFVLPPAGPFKYRLVVDMKPVTEEEYLREAERQGGIETASTQNTSTATSGNATGAVPGEEGKPRRIVPGAKSGAKPRAATMPGNLHKAREAARKKLTRKRVVVIDAGHGGPDPGATGISGAFEKTITLYTARKLRRSFLATKRYKVVMTRDGDRIVPLRERIAIARKAKADLFISLHADTITRRKVRGAAVYTLSENASDREAARLARRENESGHVAGIDLRHEDRQVSKILIDLAQRDTMNESAQFATTLIGSFQAHKIETLFRTHRFAGFVVLKAPDVPAVLVELGFLSNRTDEKLLRTSKYRAKLATAIVRAADKYFALKDRLAQR